MGLGQGLLESSARERKDGPVISPAAKGYLGLVMPRALAL